jgi:tetratricopeptide (TPR) repeat protein
VFDLKDEITRNMVASIQTTVRLSTIQEPVERASRPDLTVWELTMRAWHLLYDFTPESYAHAKTLLERALAIDPTSAEANMILSLVNHYIAIMGFVPGVQPAMETAYALARRATQFDDRNEYAHWALGISCWGLLKSDESPCSPRARSALNPNCAVAYGSLGTLLGILGRPDEAITNQEVAIRSNPLDPSIFFRFSGLALTHYMDGRFETAIEWAKRAIHRMPHWYCAHFVLAASHVALDHEENAARTVKICQKALPDICVNDLDRIPIKHTDKRNELRARLFKARFSK